jgi:hypothetical protein
MLVVMVLGVCEERKPVKADAGISAFAAQGANRHFDSTSQSFG